MSLHIRCYGNATGKKHKNVLRNEYKGNRFMETRIRGYITT